LCNNCAHSQVIIGTHGRLKNWVAKRQLDVDRICILVFDEADEMLKADAFADDSGEASGIISKNRTYQKTIHVVFITC
jgi:ATP-dependent RNA helicase DDX19/DBP5